MNLDWKQKIKGSRMADPKWSDVERTMGLERGDLADRLAGRTRWVADDPAEPEHQTLYLDGEEVGFVGPNYDPTTGYYWVLTAVEGWRGGEDPIPSHGWAKVALLAEMVRHYHLAV